MEAVSPKLNTKQKVSQTFDEFWEAMGVHFDVKRESSCGGHVHITPLNTNNKFSLDEIRQIAFATVVYEDLIHSILPPARGTSGFCVPNTRLSSRLKRSFASGK